jgi:hypothetical protein
MMIVKDGYLALQGDIAKSLWEYTKKIKFL